MSQPRGFGLNGKSIYSNICKPCEVWCNFIVDHSNGNGLGVRSIKSNGYVNSVFMNTSSTPGSMNGQLNPNPAAGYALVTFANNFNYYLGGFSGQITPLAGSNLTATVSGGVYIITGLGTATLAQWLAAGLPPGYVPAVGQAFVAIASATIGGGATVKVPGEQIAPIVSVVGNPNLELNNANIAVNGGAEIILQFSGATSSSVTTLIPTAPADGTVVGLSFNFDGSSVSIDGL